MGISLPSRNQVINGRGSASARQRKVTVEPSGTFWSSGVLVMTGGELEMS